MGPQDPAVIPAPNRLALFAGDIKLHHSIFAMPWALLSAVLACRFHPGSFAIGKIVLIVICMVAARTVAMAANRLFDAELDAKNPRTQRRPLAAGRVSRGFYTSLLVFFATVFIAMTAMFQVLYQNRLPIILSVPLLVYLCAYPFMKRLSALCHFYLGAALGLAPLCAWVAMAGSIAWPPVVMFVAVATWTAGFDIIYGCQDYQSDLNQGIHSVPVRLGIAGALALSRGTHVISAAMIVLLAWVGSFGWWYAAGAAAAISLLIVEQSLVKPNDLSKANLAFFTCNGIVSLLLGALGIIDVIR